MRRNKYVDENGNPINYGFESKKPLLNLFFVFSVVIPIVLIGVIIYTVVNTNYCHNIYDDIKKASFKYLKDNKNLPENEGDHKVVQIKDLYEHSYITDGKTANKTCTGTIKVTKYEDEYLYTLDVNNCDKCSVSRRYKSYGEESDYLDRTKTIVDVTPYYNLYDRQIGVTEWSDYYDAEELAKKASKYGVRLPKDKSEMPEEPSGSAIVEAQKEEKTFYSYSDKSWKWYDIVGDYSGFASEQPSGYAYRDDDTRKYTEYTDYSLNYPEEHEYRDIRQKTGYKFYYIDENGKKIYANNGKYTVEDEVDLNIYTERDDESATMYSYRDEVWRWYNGEKRSYSSFRRTGTDDYPYRDDELYSLDSYSSWDEESNLTPENASYRVEKTKIMTRFRYVYEILSLKILDKDLPKKEFEKQTNMTLKQIRENENYKLEVNYKFRYRDAK